MQTKTFPQRVQKFGVSATIYAPKNKDKGFTVAYHVRGKLVRKVRNDYQTAVLAVAKLRLSPKLHG
jgi:hypothetical protein